MYLSNNHKLLFIAVPRTASNSVQAALIGSGMRDPSDVVYSLNSPSDQEAILDYHMRPSVLIGRGIISLEDLSDYTAFGFVRDPFDRWVSSIFLARYTGVLDSSEDPMVQICNLVRGGDSPRPFHQRFANGSLRNAYGPFGYDGFFFHEGNQVVDAYRFEDAEAVTRSIVSEKLGTLDAFSFPHIQVNPDKIPVRFRQPLDTWLPEDCYEKIQQFFADDLAFYNSIEPFSG